MEKLILYFKIFYFFCSSYCKVFAMGTVNSISERRDKVPFGNFACLATSISRENSNEIISKIYVILLQGGSPGSERKVLIYT